MGLIPSSIFDDKMVVINARQRGGIRDKVIPQLLDLARKPNFLHDSSVPSMDNLLDPVRGSTAPHQFFFFDKAQRDDMVEFLRGLTAAHELQHWRIRRLASPREDYLSQV